MNTRLWKPGLAKAGRRSALVTLLLVPVIFLLPSGGMSADQDEKKPKLEDARSLISEWVRVSDLISKERTDWEISRELLQDQIALRRAEIESLRKSIAEAEESIAKADERRRGLDRELEGLNEAARAVQSAVVEYEARIVKLLKLLPDPIRERVKPLSQQIPEDPETTKILLGTRFRNVVGILNEVNKFNREITVTSEVRSLPDGTTVEVTSMYVGIGQGYYVSPDGKAAGVGRPSPDGWAWTPANDAAAAIAKAIAIHKNEEVASFVQLPIRID
jgi:hypothetical protein